MNRAKLIERLEAKASECYILTLPLPGDRIQKPRRWFQTVNGKWAEDRYRRIRSIIRRLRICPICMGTTINLDALLWNNEHDIPCPRCNGTGRIA